MAGSAARRARSMASARRRIVVPVTVAAASSTPAASSVHSTSGPPGTLTPRSLIQSITGWIRSPTHPSGPANGRGKLGAVVAALLEHPLRLAARLGGGAPPRPPPHAAAISRARCSSSAPRAPSMRLAHGDRPPVDALDGEQLRARGLVVRRALGEGGQLGAADRLRLRRRRGRQRERREQRRGEALSHEEVAGSSGGRKPPVELGGGDDSGRSGEVSKRDASAPTPCASSWRSKPSLRTRRS